ncbi:MAG: ComF family protein [Betaproteobacteria bacterium]|nr:ComF family protein [Betaproteobacteria bacterium]
MLHVPPFIRQAVDRTFAQDCCLCGRRTHAPWCEACDAGLPRAAAPACPQCAAVSPLGERCGRCVADPPFFDAAVVAFQYAFPLDRLMLAYKFRAQLALAGAFAAALVARVHDAAGEVDRLVPLPISAGRLATRGFDQTALLATELARAIPALRLERALLKARDTPPQSGLDREARLKNVRGAFRCTANLAGQHVAVLDDVMTTGATLSEAARVLKRAGAARVTAWAVARADHGPGGTADRAIPF